MSRLRALAASFELKSHPKTSQVGVKLSPQVSPRAGGAASPDLLQLHTTTDKTGVSPACLEGWAI